MSNGDEKVEESDPMIKDDLAGAHTWKPIKRSFLRSSPLENSGVFLLSELPMPVLHMEYDWAVKKKNVRMLIWIIMSIIICVAELEVAYNPKMAKYEMKTECEILKGVNSFITTMLLYYLYDYYDYQVAGAKKEWYKILYDGGNPGPMPKFRHYTFNFMLEFLFICVHAVPYADFRYWTDASGIKKAFISDKINTLCLLRLYWLIRVVRDYTPIYSRRRLVYDGGYRERGGPEINYKLAFKAQMTIHEGIFVALTYGGSLVTLGYMYHCGERDWQPEKYTFINTIWLVGFQFAAVDFNDMAPVSEFGTVMSLIVIVWGLIIISMLVNVIFNIVMLSSFEGWAIDWLDQYELCEEERDQASKVLKHWWVHKLNIKKKGPPKDDPTAEASYTLALVQFYKKLRDITFMVERNNPDANADPVTELMVGMKGDLRNLASKLLGAEDAAIADDEPEEGEGNGDAAPPTINLAEPAVPVYEQAGILANRVVAMEETQGAILRNVKRIYERQRGQPPPEP